MNLSRKQNSALILFVVLSFLLLLALCIVCLLSFDRLSRRLDAAESALRQEQEILAALSEADREMILLAEEKADREALDDLGRRFEYETASFVKDIAHRGFSSEAPENTLPAFVLAKQKGFNYAETDIRFTVDGYAVCLHDDTVDRTSNGSGPISELTLAEARQLDFGSWFSEEYAGTTIPLYEEFLVLCRNLGLRAYVEIKDGTRDQIRGLVKTARSYGMEREITWISFNAELLRAVLQEAPNARLGLLVAFINTETISVLCSLQNGTSSVFLNSNSFTGDEIQLCKEAGIPLEVWTVDAVYRIIDMDPYVSGVTSNTQDAGRILAESSAAR